MDKLVIEGGKSLKGTVRISGAKNACLPILAATLLSDEKSVIKNIPALRDMSTMLKILKNFGVRVAQDGPTVTVEPHGYKKYIAPYDLVSTMRASVCVLGPLLAKLGRELPTPERTADHFVLFQSHCLPEGARYEALKIYPLSKKA